jgi:hypothetical protein
MDKIMNEQIRESLKVTPNKENFKKICLSWIFDDGKRM